MISVQEAITIIDSKAIKLPSQTVSLTEALGYSLAEDLISPIDMPPFNQSAMDGYAVSTHSSSNYSLIGEVKAGDQCTLKVSPGECVRIFTGAMIPTGADSVVKQELVTVLSDTEIQVQAAISAFENIRLKGEQIKLGEIGLPKGTFLNTGAIGFAAMLGTTSLKVFRKPKITIVATGSELIKPGNKLPTGAVYESNTFMLEAALKTSNFDATTQTAEDDYLKTKNKLKNAIDLNDVVVVTGGISVGDYDFVGTALSELGVTTGFYKVKQKPGKPLFFGYKGKKLIFALPGNPAAALSCYYNYVLPALNLLTGKTKNHLAKRTLTLQSNYSKTVKMTHFLKGYAYDEKVQILGKQSSAMLNSFVDGNCLIILEEGKENWSTGDKVQVILTPQ